MPSPNNRRQLAATMAGSPAMSQLYAAYQNKYHPGPDTPIDWNAFGSEPQAARPQQSPSILSALGIASPATAGQGGLGGQGSGPIGDLVMKMMMMGWNPEKEFDPRKKGAYQR